MKESKKIWTVGYYENESDWRKGIKTFIEFCDFESAKDFTNAKTSNRMGSVILIHPKD